MTDSDQSQKRDNILVNLLEEIESLMTAEDASIKGLAKAAGLDPARDFQGIYLQGMPLAEQDVDGFDFSESDLSDTGIENAKNIRRAKFNYTIFSGRSLDPRVIEFNRKLKDMPFRQVENELRSKIEAGVRLYDVITFTTTITKAPDYARAKSWYEQMRHQGIRPDQKVFNGLISKAPPAETSFWLEQMKKEGVSPSEGTVSAVIDKSQSYEEAQKLFLEFKNSGMKFDPGPFNVMMEKSRTEAEATHWFAELQSANVRPNVITYTTLISRSESEASAAKWYREMLTTKVDPNYRTFSALLRKATTAANAKLWYQQMIDAGSTLDPSTVKTLAARFGNGDDAKFWQGQIDKLP